MEITHDDAAGRERPESRDRRGRRRAARPGCSPGCACASSCNQRIASVYRHRTGAAKHPHRHRAAGRAPAARSSALLVIRAQHAVRASGRPRVPAASLNVERVRGAHRRTQGAAAGGPSPPCRASRRSGPRRPDAQRTRRQSAGPHARHAQSCRAATRRAHDPRRRPHAGTPAPQPTIALVGPVADGAAPRAGARRGPPGVVRGATFVPVAGAPRRAVSRAGQPPEIVRAGLGRLRMAGDAAALAGDPDRRPARRARAHQSRRRHRARRRCCRRDGVALRPCRGPRRSVWHRAGRAAAAAASRPAHTLVDTGLRLALAPSRLRNLHAVGLAREPAAAAAASPP